MLDTIVTGSRYIPLCNSEVFDQMGLTLSFPCYTDGSTGKGLLSEASLRSGDNLIK